MSSQIIIQGQKAIISDDIMSKLKEKAQKMGLSIAEYSKRVLTEEAEVEEFSEEFKTKIVKAWNDYKENGPAYVIEPGDDIEAHLQKIINE